MSTIDEIMSKAQVFASAWSLVGGRFDDGSGLEHAEECKAAMRDMISAALADARRDGAEDMRAIVDRLDAQAEEIERLKASQSMTPASAARGEIALRRRVQADGLYAVDMLVSNLSTEAQAHAAMAYMQRLFAGEEIAGRH